MPKGYHHLTRDKRCQLSILIASKESVGIIAKRLAVHRSSVYRELHRNRRGSGYNYELADRFASKRRHRANHNRKKIKGPLLSLLGKKLNKQWSPEQIAGWLKEHGCKHTVSHETIYKYIWQEKRMGRSIYQELRHRGKKYYHRRNKTKGAGIIPNKVMITERPKIVEEKERLGDWEIDTIIGSSHRGAIVSMVDRASKLTKLAKVNRKTAAEVTKALVQTLKPLEACVLTLTSDNGLEFAYHAQVSSSLKAGFYFAKPYHSWERGLNEHTNGLIRQYLPKGSSFNDVSEERLLEIESLLNNRPRKVLNFSTPLEVFSKLSRGKRRVALRA